MDEPLSEQPVKGVAEEPGRRSRWSLALRLVAVALVAAVLALVAWATLKPDSGKSLVTKISAGEKPPAPVFALPVIWTRRESWPVSLARALADGTLTLAELRGHPVVLNFWASWCIPCRDEAPILRASSLAHRGKVVFLGIDMQDLRGDALAFLREFDVPYPSVYDRGDKINRKYGTTGVPESYFLDARGRIVAHVPGAVDRRLLEQGIAQISR